MGLTFLFTALGERIVLGEPRLDLRSGWPFQLGTYGILRRWVGYVKHQTKRED